MPLSLSVVTVPLYVCDSIIVCGDSANVGSDRPMSVVSISVEVVVVTMPMPIVTVLMSVVTMASIIVA